MAAAQASSSVLGLVSVSEHPLKVALVIVGLYRILLLFNRWNRLNHPTVYDRLSGSLPIISAKPNTPRYIFISYFLFMVADGLFSATAVAAFLVGAQGRYVLYPAVITALIPLAWSVARFWWHFVDVIQGYDDFPRIRTDTEKERDHSQAHEVVHHLCICTARLFWLGLLLAAYSTIIELPPSYVSSPLEVDDYVEWSDAMNSGP